MTSIMNMKGLPGAGHYDPETDKEACFGQLKALAANPETSCRQLESIMNEHCDPELSGHACKVLIESGYGRMAIDCLKGDYSASNKAVAACLLGECEETLYSDAMSALSRLMIAKMRDRQPFSAITKAQHLLKDVPVDPLLEEKISALAEASKSYDSKVRVGATKGIAAILKKSSMPQRAGLEAIYYQALSALSDEEVNELKPYVADMASRDFCPLALRHNPNQYDSIDHEPSGHRQLFYRCTLCGTEWKEWNDE